MTELNTTQLMTIVGGGDAPSAGLGTKMRVFGRGFVNGVTDPATVGQAVTMGTIAAAAGGGPWGAVGVGGGLLGLGGVRSGLNAVNTLNQATRENYETVPDRGRRDFANI